MSDEREELLRNYELMLRNLDKPREISSTEKQMIANAYLRSVKIVPDPIDARLSALTASMAALERENERLKAELARAFSVLSGLGVSTERARNVANGIMVFDQRLRKELQAIEADNAALRGRVEEARLIFERSCPWFQIQEVAHPKLSAKARAIWQSMQQWLSTLPAPIPGERGEKKCAQCGDRLTGHEDDSSTLCRFCITGYRSNEPSSANDCTTTANASATASGEGKV